MKAKYVHTNLIAENWKKLAGFYTKVFGCTFVSPERDYKGLSLDAATALKDAHLTGAHFRLPGYDENGPTLEIFNYNMLESRSKTVVNRPGYGHIAFEVEDVNKARRTVEEHGGSVIGEVVTHTINTGAKVTWCYVTDPEGNIIELQSWEK
ncbi:MAG: VOC family protein [Ignavibacteriaceae bacterium]